ncbi:MAG: outer membrane protein assembly factor BamE [Gammaproteobacteria bacterium]|nr:outer membrane protein assembly factor BamE [Gammaproteobacteria bacterium]
MYKVPIQQGNLVEQKQVDQLRVGMSKSQVNFILGTPLVVDTFNPDRWDYVYRVAIGGEITKEQRFSVFFRDDKLSAMSGNLKPSAATAALELAPSQN